MMGLLSRGYVQSYFYLFEGLGINSQLRLGKQRVWDSLEGPARVLSH